VRRLLPVLALLLFSCRTTLTEEFREIYKQRDELVKQRNVDALLAQTTPDYEVKLRNGQKMSRDQLRERWTFFYEKVLVRHISFIDEIRSVARRGDETVVTFEQKDHRIQNGREGKPVEVEANVIHMDTWIQTPAGWKLRLTEEGQQTKLTIDGKPQSSP
jgi:hypothetical protein